VLLNCRKQQILGGLCQVSSIKKEEHQMLATVKAKKDHELIRNSATVDAYLSRIRELWKSLYPKRRVFRGGMLNELEHYLNAFQLELSVLADSSKLAPAERHRLQIQLQLCSKILIVLLRQCRTGTT
jgi:hypothetical protein